MTLLTKPRLLAMILLFGWAKGFGDSITHKLANLGDHPNFRSVFDRSSIIEGKGIQEKEGDRFLQTNTCAPFNTATPISIDLTGSDVTSIEGSTFGASANLPDLDGCVTDYGAPTAWYRFTTTRRATIVMTT